jgi:hypothetical protein
VLTPIESTGAAPREDVAPHCPRCGGLAPRAASTTLASRVAERVVVAVEVQVFWCSACELALVEMRGSTAPLLPTTAPAPREDDR